MPRSKTIKPSNEAKNMICTLMTQMYFNSLQDIRTMAEQAITD